VSPARIVAALLSVAEHAPARMRVPRELIEAARRLQRQMAAAEHTHTAPQGAGATDE
jgi:hypothetical protein